MKITFPFCVAKSYRLRDEKNFNTISIVKNRSHTQIFSSFTQFVHSMCFMCTVSADKNFNSFES